MKQLVNKKRTSKEFNMGDLVYIKLKHYRQMSVARISNQKLSMKFFGPYLVKERVGPVSYRLQFPTVTRIHDVLRVS